MGHALHDHEYVGVGSPMIIYLAGIKNVPESLYEAAEIDGAGWRRIL